MAPNLELGTNVTSLRTPHLTHLHMYVVGLLLLEPSLEPLKVPQMYMSTVFLIFLLASLLSAFFQIQTMNSCGQSIGN